MPNDEKEFVAALQQATDRILASQHPRKLIVAGPGTGKTTLFEKLLEATAGEKSLRLVLTFINNLKAELENRLWKHASVFTFHGYCHYLLRRNEYLRTGLTGDFHYFPPLPSLIKRDWEILNGGSAPHFVGFMRELHENDDTDFYLGRSDYYDAVAFDDSVFRVHGQLRNRPTACGQHELLLVDEYQDFNALEASFIELLARETPIVIVGDDDQALYSQLRGASHEFIRALYHRNDYERFELPFCMRCPEVVVSAIDDLVQAAAGHGHLLGRITKPYRYYPPKKGLDSQRYPKLLVVSASVQTKTGSTNYLGRYIAQAIRRIPTAEIRESRADGFPTALVIGSKQYLDQIREHLTSEGFVLDGAEDKASEKLVRRDGLRLLKRHPLANVGWRVMVEVDQPEWLSSVVGTAVRDGVPLSGLIPEGYTTAIADEVAAFVETPSDDEPEESTILPPDQPSIKLTTFEGSKGLSAQHVFIVGLQERELPRNAAAITDLEICRLIVALTRTRKQCHLLHVGRFAGEPKRPSVFLSWIKSDRKRQLRVDKDYWMQQ